ncbi:MAG: cupin domain-containing protein [Alphaproteobacteria bacterium]
MARAHIEFIQSQVLPWIPLDSGSSRPGAAIKVLSHDPDTAAGTAILRYPDGWALDEAHHVAGDEEFFVLEGALHIDDRIFDRHAYGFLPAGFPRRRMAAPQGAAVVTFFNGPPRRVPGAGRFDAARVVMVDTDSMAWNGDFDHNLTGSGIGIKFLRNDAASGERTWLLTKGSDRREDLPQTGKLESHPCVEEFFLLDGTLGWPQGMMRRGAYFWRPPGIAHGPGASLTGYLGLFRSREGPFSTDWSQVERPRPFDPPYDPILPPAYAHYSGSAYLGADPY